MARDTDFDLFSDIIPPLDDISRRLLCGRNLHMAYNGFLQRASRKFLKTIPKVILPSKNGKSTYLGMF